MLLASAVNVLVGIVALGFAVGVGVGVFRLARRRRVDSSLLRSLASSGASLPARLQARPAQLILRTIMFAWVVRARERRSPGFRVLGLRRVDMHTGGEVTRKQEIIRMATRQVWRMLCERLIPSPKPAAWPGQEKLQSDIQAARQRYAEDEEALQQEIMRIYQQNKPPSAHMSCLPVYARMALVSVIDIPIFWSERKQSLVDRLAGTMIVLDRPSRRG